MFVVLPRSRFLRVLMSLLLTWGGVFSVSWAGEPAQPGVERLLVMERFVWPAKDAKAFTSYGWAEVHRQAVLMHARRRGWVTRDAALDEPLPAARATIRFTLAGHQENGEGGVLRIETVGGARPGSSAFPLPEGIRGNLTTVHWELARFMEAALAEGGELAAHLDGLGLAPATAHRSPSAIQPAMADAALADPLAIIGEWGLAELLGHVRKLHLAEGTPAAGPDHHLGLAVTYAKLGKITEWASSPLHQVFKARSRLYGAEVVRSGTPLQSAIARAWLSAMELAMGSCSVALQDLRAAGGGDLPWVSAFDAFSRWRDDELEQAALANPTDRWSAPLAVFLVEYSGDAVSMVRLGELALARSPRHTRVISALGYAAGPFVRQDMGRLQLRTAQVDIQGYLDALNLSKHPLVAALGKPRSGGQQMDLEWMREALDLLAALAADPEVAAAVPDLGLAFHAYRELYFNGAYAVISGATGAMGARVSPVETFMPLLKGHPWVSALRLTSAEAEASADLRRRLLAECRFDRDLSLGASGVLASIYRNENLLPATAQAKEILLSDERDSLWEVSAMGRLIMMDKSFGNRGSQRRREIPELLLRGSPGNPWAIVALLEGGNKVVDDTRLNQWIAEYGDIRPLRRAFGSALLNRKRYADAEPLLRQSAEGSPDPIALKNLAEVYRKQGDDDRWVATMERILSAPGVGLEQFMAHKEIGDHYLNKGDLDQALVHARKATQSGAGWAYLFAMVVYEMRGDFASAEVYARRTAEAYRGSHWLNFCLRTGHGDRAAAEAQLAEQWKQWLNPLDVMAGRGITSVFLERYADAARIIEEYVKEAPPQVVVEPFMCLLWMTSALQEKDHEAFLRGLEALRSRAHTRGRTLGKNLKKLGELFAVTVAAGPEAIMEEKAFRDCLRAIDRKDLITLHVLAGAFYEARGHTEQARTQYQAGWNQVPFHHFDILSNSPSLCAQGLRRTGGQPYPVKGGR